MRPDYTGSHGPSYKVLIHPKSSGVSGKGHYVCFTKDCSGLERGQTE